MSLVSVELGTTVGGIPLDCCIYNASGPRTGSADALGKIAASSAGAVLSKSATLKAQTGNPMPRYKEIDLGTGSCWGSINSEGLPNKGIDYYISAETVSAVSKHKKPYMVSLSGLCLEDNLTMFEKASNVEDVCAIELNVACPNIPGKPVIAYDFDQLRAVLDAITSHASFGVKPLGVKLAPYFDLPHFNRAAEILNQYPIQFVVCTNTIGNALVVDAEAEQPLIAPKGGLGGLAGGYIKHTALANVRQMRLLLRDTIDVVGVGGVRSGEDAFELILCGASAVQVGTCHWSEGPQCFDRIAAELKDLMGHKGYKSINDFKGKLRDYDRKQASPSTKVTRLVRGPAGGSAKAAGGSANPLVYVVAVLLAVIAALVAELARAR